MAGTFIRVAREKQASGKILGLDKEVGSGILVILTSPWKQLSQNFAYCLDNFVFTVLLVLHCTTIDLNSCM